MLSADDVAEIAHLARLELSADHIEELRGELSSILEHVRALQAVDTEGVEPMTHAVPMTLRLRDDVVEDSLPAERAVEAAPSVSDGSFVVPNIIKSNA